MREFQFCPILTGKPMGSFGVTNTSTSPKLGLPGALDPKMHPPMKLFRLLISCVRAPLVTAGLKLKRKEIIKLHHREKLEELWQQEVR
jgi:hypothetical protein